LEQLLLLLSGWHNGSAIISFFAEAFLFLFSLQGWFCFAVVFFLPLPLGSFWAALDARGHPFRFGVLQSSLGNVRHVEFFNSDDFRYGFFC
jgi:hypothetical protein